VRQQKFRPDLYARLEGVTVCLPHRERPADAVLLFRRILMDRSAVTPTAADFVERPHARWPYNVREWYSSRRDWPYRCGARAVVGSTGTHRTTHGPNPRRTRSKPRRERTQESRKPLNPSRRAHATREYPEPPTPRAITPAGGTTTRQGRRDVDSTRCVRRDERRCRRAVAFRRDSGSDPMVDSAPAAPGRIAWNRRRRPLRDRTT
jgi:hypothetical protein